MYVCGPLCHAPRTVPSGNIADGASPNVLWEKFAISAQELAMGS
jgi:hypothetical protein